MRPNNEAIVVALELGASATSKRNNGNASMPAVKSHATTRASRNFHRHLKQRPKSQNAMSPINNIYPCGE